jgi:hypothetical protein
MGEAPLSPRGVQGRGLQRGPGSACQPLAVKCVRAPVPDSLSAGGRKGQADGDEGSFARS